MSILPRLTFEEVLVGSERLKWREVPGEKRIFDSFEELQKAVGIPLERRVVEEMKDSGYGYRQGYEVFIDPTTHRYGKPNIGYHCGTCDKYLLDPPLIHSYDTIRMLAGARGYAMNCRQCKMELRDVRTAVS